jgi:hypothetical protein
MSNDPSNIELLAHLWEEFMTAIKREEVIISVPNREDFEIDAWLKDVNKLIKRMDKIGG